MPRRAVFLDRDGVIIRDVDLLTRCDQVEVYPNVNRAINLLQSKDFAVVVVSNQPVVARGLVTERDVETVNAWIQKSLSREGGCQIDRFYFCPHHPNANLTQYRVTCDCRKPQPGMLLQAAQELDLDLAASYLVGDRPSDILAGHRAGCRTILLETGMHSAPLVVGNYSDDRQSASQSDGKGNAADPDFVCSDLSKAVDFILGRAGGYESTGVMRRLRHTPGDPY